MSKISTERSVRHTVDPASGAETRSVSFRRDDGALVESETRVEAERVRSRVSVTGGDGVRESWIYNDDFHDDSKDVVSHVRERLALDPGGEPVPVPAELLSREEGFSPALFLAKRGELFTDRASGVDFGPGRLTYRADYHSAVVLSSGRDASGQEAHVLASLGVHAAFPFPGEHWDEGQLAILDGNFNKRLSLRMPAASEDAHLDVRFEDFTTPDGGPGKRIVYQGYMEDDAGKLRFVEAHYELSKAEVEKKDPSLWDRLLGAVNRAIGFEQNAKLLRELEVSASSLRVDGEEVLKVERTLSAIDDGARFNLLPNTKLTAINYAPASSPLLSLLDPQEREARYRFDATLLSDEKGLLTKLLPSFLRRGTLSAHYVVNEDGTRRDVEERLKIDGPPLSTKLYRWDFDGEPAAVLKRELVRYRDPKGNVELGFRETIYRYPED